MGGLYGRTVSGEAGTPSTAGTARLSSNARRLNVKSNWLDRAVGFENFPDGDWLWEGILRGPIVGIDPASGGVVRMGPPGSGLGQLITQGVVNQAAGLMYNASVDQNGRISMLNSIQDDEDDKFLQGLRWSDLSMSAPILSPSAIMKITGT
jgi:hypothetical protein